MGFRLWQFWFLRRQRRWLILLCQRQLRGITPHPLPLFILAGVATTPWRRRPHAALRPLPGCFPAKRFNTSSPPSRAVEARVGLGDLRWLRSQRNCGGKTGVGCCGCTGQGRFSHGPAHTPAAARGRHTPDMPCIRPHLAISRGKVSCGQAALFCINNDSAVSCDRISCGQAKLPCYVSTVTAMLALPQRAVPLADD